MLTKIQKQTRMEDSRKKKKLNLSSHVLVSASMYYDTWGARDTTQGFFTVKIWEHPSFPHYPYSLTYLCAYNMFSTM